MKIKKCEPASLGFTPNWGVPLYNSIDVMQFLNQTKPLFMQVLKNFQISVGSIKTPLSFMQGWTQNLNFGKVYVHTKHKIPNLHMKYNTSFDLGVAYLDNLKILVANTTIKLIIFKKFGVSVASLGSILVAIMKKENISIIIVYNFILYKSSNVGANPYKLKLFFYCYYNLYIF